MTRPGAFDELTAEVALARNGGRCERCNSRATGELHHRRPRRMGGAGRRDAATTSGAANCLCLCTRCHDRAERRDRAAARHEGVILSAGRTPADEPVQAYMRGRWGWWLLDNDGGCTRVPAPEVSE